MSATQAPLFDAPERVRPHHATLEAPGRDHVAEVALDALRVPAHLRPGAIAWRVLRGHPQCGECRGSGFLAFSYPAKAAPDARCPKCWFGRLEQEAWIAERQIVAEVLVRFSLRGAELRVRWHDEQEDEAGRVYAEEAAAVADAAARPTPPATAPAATRAAKPRRRRA